MGVGERALRLYACVELTLTMYYKLMHTIIKRLTGRVGLLCRSQSQTTTMSRISYTLRLQRMNIRSRSRSERIAQPVSSTISLSWLKHLSMAAELGCTSTTRRTAVAEWAKRCVG